MLSPDMCGPYIGSGDAFGSCLNTDPALTDAFKSLCQYDFCENYLSQADPTMEATSSCFIDGKSTDNIWCQNKG